ncbi:hypothetical protein [Rossellomorea aquimaris]|uniref:hypothetical protein n=1 Tax=Rossellomorea aquimaris TaxID=189382 RepID=UPI0007D049FB|nr:hypothetical protein [Rossellomorea aquimaris]
MLKKQMILFIEEARDHNPNGAVKLFQEEREYALKHELIKSEEINEEGGTSRFQDATIERCSKETEELLGRESGEFLEKPLTYLKENKNEFVYLESRWFNVIGVEAVSLEMDDVFGTYDVMLGLKLQKKYCNAIEQYLDQSLQGDSSTYDLLFNGEDGLWDFNFTLNNHPDFKEDLSMIEAYEMIYRFLFQLAESVEAK